MPNESKPSGARVTGLLSGRFHVARLKLTAIYIAILATILCISSGVIYQAFASQLEQRFHRFAPSPTFQFPADVLPPRQQDVLADLVYSLFLVNGILLIFAGVSSYWLAGLTLQPIQDAYDRQRRFLSDASHELRTPLAILKLDMDNGLRESGIGEKERAHLVSNLEEVDRMSGIVSNLLALARLDENQDAAPERLREVDMGELVRGITERFQPLAKDKGVKLVCAVGPESVVAMADETLVSQAVSNVVKNAIAYNKPDGDVAIDVVKQDGLVVVKVADTGVGITPEDKARVFDRFYRADKSRSRATGGSGLGLSIVRTSIERLGGEVELDSELGRGTTVILKVPSA